MKVTHRFALPAINLDAYKKGLHRHMSDAIARAAMEWLDTVLAEIPTWSGASRATFIKLASEINFGVDIAPVAMDRTSQGVTQSDGNVVMDLD